MANPSLLHQVVLRFEDGLEHREDVSAVRLTPDKHLWLGSDETSTIECLSSVDLAFAGTNNFGLQILLNYQHRQIRN